MDLKECQCGVWRRQCNVCTPISYKIVPIDFATIASTHSRLQKQIRAAVERRGDIHQQRLDVWAAGGADSAEEGEQRSEKAKGAAGAYLFDPTRQGSQACMDEYS